MRRTGIPRGMPRTEGERANARAEGGSDDWFQRRSRDRLNHT